MLHSEVVDLLEKIKLTGGALWSAREGERCCCVCWAKGLVGPAHRGEKGRGPWLRAKEREREEFKPMNYFPFQN